MYTHMYQHVSSRGDADGYLDVYLQALSSVRGFIA